MNWSGVEKELLTQIWAADSKISILEQIPRSWKAIRRQAEHLKLKRFRAPYGDGLKKIPTPTESDFTPAWFIGEMLSDGHIDRQGRYCHTTKHKSYAKFLLSKFEDWEIPTNIKDCPYYDKRTQKTYDRTLLRTRSIFKSLRQKWYQPTKIVPQDIHINDEVFHHWIMGDGSIVGGTFRLSTMGFDGNSLKLLHNTLIEYGLQTTIEKTGNIYIKRIDENKKVLSRLTGLDWACYDYKKERIKHWIT